MQHTAHESKAMKSTGYEDGLMEVTYHSGKTYVHIGVPPELYQQFQDAESKGKFFGAHIRNQYPGKLVEPAA